jgi:hypothetical protein
MIFKITLAAAAALSVFSSAAFAQTPMCNEEITNTYHESHKHGLALLIEVAIYEQGEEGHVKKTRFNSFQRECTSFVHELTEQGCIVKMASEDELISKATESERCARVSKRVQPWVK